MELEQYHLRVPKYLMDRIRSEVIERWGYDVKGGVGLIINEVLDKNFRTEKVSTHTHIPNNISTTTDQKETQKNELAVHANPVELRTNSILNILQTDIYKFQTKNIDKDPVIFIGLLEKSIKQNFHVYDKRSIKRYIDILLTNGIIGEPEADHKNR